jgi:hypothetical protein
VHITRAIEVLQYSNSSGLFRVRSCICNLFLHGVFVLSVDRAECWWVGRLERLVGWFVGSSGWSSWSPSCVCFSCLVSFYE